MVYGEEFFHLSVYVNSQNYTYWVAGNPNNIEEHPTNHSANVSVWCTISARTVEPIFFYENVNNEMYG